MTNDTTARALTADEFVTRFLIDRRPVVVRDSGDTWNWVPEWDFDSLTKRFGSYRVPLYDTLFSLYGLSTFGDYVARHTGSLAHRTADSEAIPYLRWYARQNTDRLPWADPAFDALAHDWSMPSWLPTAGYLFPRLSGAVDAARDPFPAKGMFVCGAGGRTRLHVDPWTSDACLCQTTGSKRLLLFQPETVALLGGEAGRRRTTSGAPIDGGRLTLVDLDEPNEATFPHWREAEVAMDVVLEPGDCLYIPAGWPHAAVALTDSVSVTWNFVHEVHATDFERYLADGGMDEPTVRYFTRSNLRAN